MSGFNGAAATPVNSNAASKQRDVLSVYSKAQVDSAISQSTAVTALTTSVTMETTTDSPQYLKATQTGNMICIDIVLRSKNALTANSEVGRVTLPRNLKQQCHTACVTHTLNLARFMMNEAGVIKIENSVNANEWLAVSMFGVLS